jgi:NAD+ kinase
MNCSKKTGSGVNAIGSFGVIGFKRSSHMDEVITRIQNWSEQRKVPVLFHQALKGRTPDGARFAHSEEELMSRSDALLSVGGDGTFLAVAHMSKFCKNPVVGVNLGRVGFLTDIGAEEVEEALDRIHQGDYRTTKRMVLRAVIYRGGKRLKELRALNDIFVNRVQVPKLTTVSAWSGDNFITDFQADGIIVATPSGSTAYSLAAGGPIVEPGVKAFLLTPICPQSLTERPLILPAERPIRLKISPRNPDLLMSADGLESVKLQKGDEIVITYDGEQTNLIQLSERSYFEALREKLAWGRDYAQWRNRRL